MAIDFSLGEAVAVEVYKQSMATVKELDSSQVATMLDIDESNLTSLSFFELEARITARRLGFLEQEVRKVLGRQ